MLLVFDVGNTNTVMGIYDGSKVLNHWRLTSKKQTADEVGFTIAGLLNSSSVKTSDITGVAYASVVPSLDEMFMEGIKSYIGAPCMRVSQKLNTGLKIQMKNPTGLGADRLLNAVAGIAKYGAPLIVVDLGTTITLDVISPEGAYLGGTISPGMEIAMDSLFARAAKLPQVALEAPAHYIGGNTIEAIQSGVVYGFVGLVDSLVRGVFRELGTECTVVATGGHAPILAAHSQIITRVDQWLTLDGLRILYEKNRQHA